METSEGLLGRLLNEVATLKISRGLFDSDGKNVQLENKLLAEKLL